MMNVVRATKIGRDQQLRAEQSFHPAGWFDPGVGGMQLNPDLSVGLGARQSSPDPDPWGRGKGWKSPDLDRQGKAGPDLIPLQRQWPMQGWIQLCRASTTPHCQVFQSMGISMSQLSCLHRLNLAHGQEGEHPWLRVMTNRYGIT